MLRVSLLLCLPLKFVSAIQSIEVQVLISCLQTTNIKKSIGVIQFLKEGRKCRFKS
jgi:hypothetical protein